MDTWTITYEEEQDDGTYRVVHQTQVDVPDGALLRNESWARWLADNLAPEEWFT